MRYCLAFFAALRENISLLSAGATAAAREKN